MKFDTKEVAKLAEAASIGRRTPRGVHCTWIDLEDVLGVPVGVKRWDWEGQFRTSKLRHLKMMMTGVGVKIYGECRVHGLPALIMEKVETLQDIADRTYPNPPKPDWEVNDRRWKSWWEVKNEAYRKRSKLKRAIKMEIHPHDFSDEFYQKWGISLNDMHEENWGFVKGAQEYTLKNLRIVDVGHCGDNTLHEWQFQEAKKRASYYL